MTRLSLACAFAAGMVIATSACGGSGPKSVSVRYGSMVSAAATISHHCMPVVTSADSNGLLWLAGGPRPLAYYASSDGDPPDEVLSTRGPARRPWGLLWPCRPPVVIHYPRTHTASRSSKALLTVLATKPSKRKTITLGQIRLANPENWNSLSGYANGLIAPSGKIIFFSGTKIRYAGGPEFSVHGLPEGWQIGSLVVSPRNPFVFLAVAAANGKVGSPPCSAGVFRITRTTSVRLRSYNSCGDGLTVQWSPDGEHIAWFISPGGNAARLSISDALGRRLQRLVARPILNGVWSPDSTSIAYGYGGDNRRTAVVDVSTGASHAVGKGYPLAWSPDGKELALFRQSPVIPQPPGTVVAVPATGGRARLLFKVPAAPTS